MRNIKGQLLELLPRNAFLYRICRRYVDRYNIKHWDKFLLAIVLGFCAWAAYFIFECSYVSVMDGQRYFLVADDAYISMRYAWNLVQGNGLVWNAGEYVEGYSNLLMTLLMALSIFLFDKRIAPLAIQLIGVVCLLGNATLVMLIAKELLAEASANSRKLLGILAFGVALSYYPLNYWSLEGMETGLLTVLLSAGVFLAFINVRQPSSQRQVLMSIVLGLAYLTRPDSSVVATLIILFVFLFGWREHASLKLAWRTMLTTASIYVVFPAVQFAFRWMYYGELWPNTYTLKLGGMPLLIRLQGGWGFVSPFLISVSLLLVVACIGLLQKFDLRKLLLLMIGVGLVVYQIFVGGDSFIYWRILSPGVPFLFILFSHEVFLIAGYITKSGSQSYLKYIPASMVCIMTMAALVIANYSFLPELTFARTPEGSVSFRIDVDKALALREITTEKATIGVNRAGTVPYYSERYAIDFLGKSDKYIARLSPDLSGMQGWSGMLSVPGHNKYDLNYSIKLLQPTSIEYWRIGNQDLSDLVRKDYVLVNYKENFLFLRRDSPYVLWEKITSVSEIP